MQSMNLLSVQTNGLWWLLLLFLVCAIVVHGVKLVIIGYRSLVRKLPPQPPPKPEKTPEPVYFIVERKKKRLKSQYSEPKEIRFE